MIERARPAELADVIAACYELTAREREVVSMLLLGYPAKAIGRRLRITLHTVNDHLKAAYRKTGVSSRGEMAALFHSAHYQPMVQDHHHPGPYGWFLPPRSDD